MGLTHLEFLESESIFIIREAFFEAEKPVMLYSIGKDSSVLLHLIRKAFYPSKIPFPLLHVDTLWKFQQMYAFREQIASQSDIDLIVYVNPEGKEQGMNPFTYGSDLHTGVMKTQALKQALEKYEFDMIFGGARRDEEKSRAKERIFSLRNQKHYWDVKHQRPEVWNLFNLHKNKDESFRVFPLSNWTELDIWVYIYKENIPIVPLYFAKERNFVERDGMMILLDDDRMKLREKETVKREMIRFRTLGCYPLTGAIASQATDVPSIILELLKTKTSERDTRAIDKDGKGSMEKKKKEGYF